MLQSIKIEPSLLMSATHDKLRRMLVAHDVIPLLQRLLLSLQLDRHGEAIELICEARPLNSDSLVHLYPPLRR